MKRVLLSSIIPKIDRMIFTSTNDRDEIFAAINTRDLSKKSS